MPPTRHCTGNVIIFEHGAHAKWHVEGYVRKFAFCRKTQPVLFSLALRMFSRIKRTLTPNRKVMNLMDLP
jgi:uncharacterized protein